MVKKIIAETNVNAEEKTVSAMNGTMLWRKRCWHCEGLVFNRELFSYLIWKTTSHNGLYAEFHSLVNEFTRNGSSNILDDAFGEFPLFIRV